MVVQNSRFPLKVWRTKLFGFDRYEYILNGLHKGFPIGINPEKTKYLDRLSDKPVYIPLNVSQKKGISDWVLKLHSKGYMAGPFDENYNFPFGKLYIAPLFAVPKPDGKWRPIVHLSYKPSEDMFSVNDLLCEYMKTVQYVRFIEVVNLVNNAGKGAFIFLIDAQDAYYRVPIAADDWKYMGIRWAKKLWVFQSLQMGCSSSPRIYTMFADAVEYICVNKNAKLFFRNGLQQLRHYIDDFFGAHPTEKGAKAMFKIVFNTFDELGVPTREDKCSEPATKQKILGWVYDTILRVVGIPDDKRELLISIIEKLCKRPRSDRKSMEQLIGRIQCVSLIVFPGKAFVRRLEAALHLLKFRYNTPFELSDFVMEDLKWWLNILKQPKLCTTSFDLLLKHPSEGDFVLWSDATTTIGGGGYVTNKAKQILLYYQFDWNDTILKEVLKVRPLEIEVLELILSIVGVSIIQHKLKHKCVTIYNDNPAAAGAIRTKAPKLYRLDMQCLVRQLASLAVHNKFYFWGIHYTIKDGHPMQIADDLSRFESSIKDTMKNVTFVDALPIVNKLLLKLKTAPLNLPSKIDISRNRRCQYGILLNDDERDYSQPYFVNHVKNQYNYNILKRSSLRPCAL